MSSGFISIKGAKEHNLQNLDVEIPRDRLVVITGLSGSGKSSLAFDTIYAEGQRRYVESLSAYARQFLEQMDKPDVDSIEGLSPAISIEQKSVSRNPRSTVGTVTEIYDYLRLLYARIGTPHCPQCGKVIASQTVQQIVDQVLQLPLGSRFMVLAPIVRGRKGEYRAELVAMQRQGYMRARVDGTLHELGESIPLEKNKKHTIEVVVDRLILQEGIQNRLTESIETALKLTAGLVGISVGDGPELIFSETFACIDCGVSLPEIAPRMFSFNSPHGACADCDGLGTKRYFDVSLIIPDAALSLRDGAVKPWTSRPHPHAMRMLEALAEHYRFDLRTPFGKLPETIQQLLLHGNQEEEVGFWYGHAGRRKRFFRGFDGIIPNLERRWRESGSDAMREELEQYMGVQACPSCKGARLRPESLAVHIGGTSITEVTRYAVKEALEFFAGLVLTPQQEIIGSRILKEIRERLGFLVNVGLEYLTLDRAAATLSGGEGQRIRLATQIGSSLVGVLYILDEPSIGLHQRDNRRLLETLKRLRDLGNTVIVVEHDRDTILAADCVLDLGPFAGRHGGHLVAQGTPEQIMRSPESITGAYLSQHRVIPVPRQRRPRGKRQIEILGAGENNLKNIDVAIPLGCFTCVTGVSGSGKSTLLIDIFYKALARSLHQASERPGRHARMKGLHYLDKVVDIDQSPIGRTPRSNPATYTGVFAPIRELFAQVPEARKRGYLPGRFSFNVRGGRCEACEGGGIIKIEMHFLPDLYVRCEACKGRRFNRETLEIHYKGASIADVLDMTVDQALEFFQNVPALQEKLQTISDVGLGYIQLGQAATTLSGGEAQRVKLSKELSRRSTGRTFYILDEPTTGLHFADIQFLLNVLNRLADNGNTVVVIEHNLDVIKQADFIIDLGPEGGEAGGFIVAQGTPEEVALVSESYTGHYLRGVLSPFAAAMSADGPAAAVSAQANARRSNARQAGRRATGAGVAEKAFQAGSGAAPSSNGKRRRSSEKPA
ncbi:MAG: excinuclease ABC subunit UvrA [Candidatus Tectomicrobia bacterium]|nr:excinuclease ABC subunit UvrA [Candidatus Tectomicrobia bacterium]